MEKATIEKLNSRNGLQNVENRILAIKGTITFDTKSGKGFKSSILFPK
jgi:signal transduction histidine kinase